MTDPRLAERVIACIVGAAIAVLLVLVLWPKGKPAPTPPPAPVPTPTLAFDPPAPVAIRRAYDQRTAVSLRNDGAAPARVRLECDAPPDLVAGFVGRGSADRDDTLAAEVPPGETWSFPLVLHAADAQTTDYAIPLRALVGAATAATAVLRVAVERPRLEVAATWVEADEPADRARLARTLLVTNRGGEVPDFTLALSPELDGRVVLHPVVEQQVLAADDSVEVRIRPRLHAGFRALSGTILLRGHGQEVAVPYEVALPAGQRVHVVVTRSTTVSRNSGTRCTNRRDISYEMPPTGGTAPDPHYGGPSTPAEVVRMDTDWGGTGLEGWGASLPPVPERNEADQGIADNAAAATEGITDTVPSDASGGDADPEANTREVVVRRDGDNLDILVRRRRGHDDQGNDALDYIPVMGRGRRLRASTPIVDGSGPARNPTLGAGPGGETLAAYDRPTPDGGSEVVVVPPEGGRERLFGDHATHPQIVDGNVLWREPDGVHRADLATGEAATEVVPVDGPFRARRAPDGSIAVLPARDGDFAYAPDGRRVVVAKRPDGSIGEVGGPELVPAGWRTARPVLANTTDGVRLLVHRMLDDAGGGAYTRDYADGAWGPLLPAPRIEEPVEEAFVALNFSLPWDSANYKPMNTQVLLNGAEIGRLPLRVPNGRFAFRVPATLLHLRAAGSGEVPPNEVRLLVEGIGPGSFHITDVCEVYASHALIQDFVVAASPEEAAELARVSTEEVRHGAPDLMLTANAWEPPQDVQPGEEVAALVGLVNVGDTIAPAGRLVATAPGGAEIGAASFPAVEPFAEAHAILRLRVPEAWNVREPFLFTIRADVPGDPRPDTNELRFGLFGVEEPDLAGPEGPGRVDPRLFRDAAALPLPAEIEIVGPSRWFKVRTPGDGRLQVEVANVPEDLELEASLFGPDGLPLRNAGEWIYLRVAVRSGWEFPPGAKLKVWWETP